MSNSSRAVLIAVSAACVCAIGICAAPATFIAIASRHRQVEAPPPPRQEPKQEEPIKEPKNAGPAGNFADERIDVAGTERQFRLIVPDSVDRSRPAPLVVAFHGMLIDSKDLMPHYTKLDRLAADKKFLLAFPEAIGKSWGLAPDKVNADLAFFDALVADVSKRYRVDPDRIYVTGMSNGSYFAQIVAIQRSTKVAAACAHCGPLDLGTAILGIHAERKFPVMIVCGEKDPIFNVKWFRDNRDLYEKEKHPVKLVEVPNLGHIWATEQNDAIWEFFAANPLR